MSNLYPNNSDSIKEKCQKACFLYMTDYITIETLVNWLYTYKANFNNMESKFEYQKTKYQRMSHIYQ